MSSNFFKKLPMMHISVRHDIFCNFSSCVINVENKDKKPFFVSHFHKVLRPRPLTPFVYASSFAPNEMPETLKGRSFGSNLGKLSFQSF